MVCAVLDYHDHGAGGSPWHWPTTCPKAHRRTASASSRRSDSQKFGSLAVIVGFVQQFVVALDCRTGFGWKPEVHGDRASVLTDRDPPRFLRRVPVAQEGRSERIDQAQQAARGGFSTRRIKLEDQAKLAIESVVVGAGTDHFFHWCFEQGDGYPVRIGIVVRPRLKGGRTCALSVRPVQTTRPCPVQSFPIPMMWQGSPTTANRGRWRRQSDTPSGWAVHCCYHSRRSGMQLLAVRLQPPRAPWHARGRW